VAVEMLRDSALCPIYFPLMDAILRDGPPQSFSGVSCPVLLAWGSRDRILPTPRYSRRLREMIPAAEWLELSHLGHMPMSDDPELVARTIIAFTAKASEPATAHAAL
jgi:pimeloyl-ACP methyl ester carboxylesterase